MKVINKTNYDKKTMHRVFVAVHKRVDESIGIVHSHSHSFCKFIYVEVKYIRDGYGYSGQAGASWVTLRLPRKEVSIAKLAWLFDHEVRHCYGYDHQDYPKHMLHMESDEKVAKTHGWVIEDLSIPDKIEEQEPVKPTKEEVLAAKRAAKVSRLLEQREAWLTKQKRANNKLKKINTSLKYYQGLGFDIDV
jgi:hypothetical protein